MEDAERSVFFTDAVVAIAMTLLILPLMESVAEASRAGASTAQWLGEHADQVFSFVLSFAVISTFWMVHRRVWGRLRSMTGRISFLNTLWLLAIVWLPVATALAGSMPTDRLQAVLYIGPMVVASLCLAGVAAETVRRPDLLAHGDRESARRSLRTMLALAALYAAALLATLVLPAVGYYGMFLLLLMVPATRWIHRGPSTGAGRTA